MKIRRILYVTAGLTALVVLAGAALLWASGRLGRPYHATPLAALSEFPGFLEGAGEQTMQSVRVLQEQPVAGGVVLLYRWQRLEREVQSDPQLSVTFVTPDGKGWRAQASGSKLIPEPSTFVATYTVGGNITPLTTAFGIASEGREVRLVWSDGKVTTVPLQNGSFLAPRPATLCVERFELLGDGGQVLRTRDSASPS